MSGGHFDYNQYRIDLIIESIEEVINNNMVKVEKKNSWYQSDDRVYYYEYPNEVIEKFKEGVKQLRIARIYAQRIDWLLSGDDGEESFFNRLEEDFNNLK